MKNQKYPAENPIGPSIRQHAAFRATQKHLGELGMSFKFGSLQNGNDAEYKYGNLFCHEKHPQWSRVTIAPSNKQIPLMLDIANKWSGPFSVLYVLSVSRLGRKSARYQSPDPIAFDDLELLAYSFQEYFEGDGRHHLWFIDIPTNSQIVYDNHNLIYSYKNDDQVISLLREKGYSEGEPEIPVPHSHRYNVEFDNSEDVVMRYFKWIEFPVNEEHDN